MRLSDGERDFVGVCGISNNYSEVGDRIGGGITCDEVDGVGNEVGGTVDKIFDKSAGGIE